MKLLFIVIVLTTPIALSQTIFGDFWLDRLHREGKSLSWVWFKKIKTEEDNKDDTIPLSHKKVGNW